MLVKMLRSTSGPNGLACMAGEVHDLPPTIVRAWTYEGRCVPVEDATPLDNGVVTMNGDPMVADNRATRPKRGR